MATLRNIVAILREIVQELWILFALAFGFLVLKFLVEKYRPEYLKILWLDCLFKMSQNPRGMGSANAGEFGVFDTYIGDHFSLHISLYF